MDFASAFSSTGVVGWLLSTAEKNLDPESPAPCRSRLPDLFTRASYAKWLLAQANGTPTPAAHTQIDTDRVLPYYA